MRVAFVCADAGIPVFGRKGGSIHVQEFVRALLGWGVEVAFYATRLSGLPPVGFETVDVRIHTALLDKKNGLAVRVKRCV